MRKILQYLKIVLIAAPVILYYHFIYMIKFSRHPEKYPLEKRYRIARKEISFVIGLFHLDYTMENFEVFTNSKDKSLLISNHLSFLDPLMIIIKSEKPVTFIAKKEVFKMPFVGRVAKALEVFPLDRDNIMSQLSEIKKVVTYLKDPNKPSVIVYIEGTRNRNPENPCLDFHAGTLKIAQMAGCPINVAATYGSFRALSKKSCLRKYPVYFSILETIPADEFKKINTNDLAGQLRKKVDAKVDELRALDKKYIESMKISEKKKTLETMVDARAKA